MKKVENEIESCEDDITWLWPGRIAVGHVTSILDTSSNGVAGKLSADIAANITKGRGGPVDGVKLLRQGGVLYAGGRLAARAFGKSLVDAGADMREARSISCTPIDAAGASEKLRRAIVDFPRCCLVVYGWRLDSYTNGPTVSQIVAGLATIARDYSVAVLTSADDYGIAEGTGEHASVFATVFEIDDPIQRAKRHSLYVASSKLGAGAESLDFWIATDAKTGGHERVVWRNV